MLDENETRWVKDDSGFLWLAEGRLCYCGVLGPQTSRQASDLPVQSLALLIFGMPLLVSEACGFDLRLVRVRPIDQRHDRPHKRTAQRRQRVFHAWWNSGIEGARYQSILFQALERQGQHPLRDLPDLSLEGIEAHRAAGKVCNDQDAPFIANPAEQIAGE